MLRAVVARLDPGWGKCAVAAPTVRRIVSHSVSYALAASVIIAGHSASAQTPTNAPIKFDIPSQALNTALGQYSDLTGRQGLYDASLTRFRRSGEVHGILLAENGLRMLLSGTGLEVQFFDDTTFVLLPESEAVDQSAAGNPLSFANQRYFGIIQTSLLHTLCKSRGARPARYRFVALLWIESDGSIRRAQRIGSTGALDTDQRIDAALRSVKVSEPPPPGFAQPVLMLIVPEGSLVTGCDEVLANHPAGRLAR